MNYEFILRAAIGLYDLGLSEESEHDLLLIPPEAPQFGRAQNELLVTRLARGAYELAAGAGRGVMERDGATHASFLNTSLALSFLGRGDEAREVMRRLYRCGRYQPNGAYQIACLDSRLGNFAEALHWLSLALTGCSSYLTKALIDSDLQPLWHALENRTLSRTESQILQLPVFATLLELGAPCPQDVGLDGNDLKLLPESWRRLFRFVPAQGTYSLHALTALPFPQERAACEAWIQARVETTRGILSRTLKVATGMWNEEKPG